MQDNSPLATLGVDTPPVAPPKQQVAALCWRKKRGRVEVLLVTSRDTGRWVLPKGGVVKGLDLSTSAGVEAWEEAGAKGQIASEPLGEYAYDKTRVAKPALPCSVAVFPLRVENLSRHFPERKERRRKWFSADDAAKLVAEPSLRDLLMRVAAEPLIAPFAP